MNKIALYSYAIEKKTNKVALGQVRIFFRTYLQYDKCRQYLSGVCNSVILPVTAVTVAFSSDGRVSSPLSAEEALWGLPGSLV